MDSKQYENIREKNIRDNKKKVKELGLQGLYHKFESDVLQQKRVFDAIKKNEAIHDFELDVNKKNDAHLHLLAKGSNTILRMGIADLTTLIVRTVKEIVLIELGLNPEKVPPRIDFSFRKRDVGPRYADEIHSLKYWSGLSRAVICRKRVFSDADNGSNSEPPQQGSNIYRTNPKRTDLIIND